MKLIPMSVALPTMISLVWTREVPKTPALGDLTVLDHLDLCFYNGRRWQELTQTEKIELFETIFSGTINRDYTMPARYDRREMATQIHVKRPYVVQLGWMGLLERGVPYTCGDVVIERTGQLLIKDNSRSIFGWLELEDDLLRDFMDHATDSVPATIIDEMKQRRAIRV